MTVIAEQFLAPLSRHSPPQELLPGGHPNCHRRPPGLTTAPAPSGRAAGSAGPGLGHPGTGRGGERSGKRCGHCGGSREGEERSLLQGRGNLPTLPVALPQLGEQENQLKRRDRRRGGLAAYWAWRAGDGEPSRDALCQRTPVSRPSPGS